MEEVEGLAPNEAPEVIDVQAEMQRRLDLINQRIEVERALEQAEKHKAAIIKQLRKQAEDLYCSLGIKKEEVWADLAASAPEPQNTSSPGQTAQLPMGEGTPDRPVASRKKPSAMLPTHKWTAPDGQTYYCNRNSKGRRPEWLQQYAEHVKTSDNEVRYDVMQPYDDATDRAQWLMTVVRAKKPGGGS